MSKITYIYLNTYHISGKTYYYVGSHTCLKSKLNSAGYDPSYQGSSKVANHFNWSPVEIKVLESFDSTDKLRYKAEHDWILYYAQIYGVSPLACYNPNSFTSTYQKPNGLLLNGHSNSSEQLHNKETYNKSLKTRLNKGHFKNLSKQSHTNAVEERRSFSKKLNTRLTSIYHKAAIKRVNDYGNKPAIKAAKVRSVKQQDLSNLIKELRVKNNTYLLGAIKAAETKRLKGNSGAVKHTYKVTYNNCSQIINNLAKFCRDVESIYDTKLSRITISQNLLKYGSYAIKGFNFKLLS